MVLHNTTNTSWVRFGRFFCDFQVIEKTFEHVIIFTLNCLYETSIRCSKVKMVSRNHDRVERWALPSPASLLNQVIRDLECIGAVKSVLMF